MGGAIRIRRRLRVGLWLPLALLAGSVAAGEETQEPRGTVVSETETQVIFDAALPRPRLSPRAFGDRSYVAVEVDGCDHAGKAGQPDLPTRDWLIALPPGAEALVEVIEEDAVPLGAARPLPVAEQDLERPTPGADDGREPMPGFLQDFVEDPLVYESLSPFPVRTALAGRIRGWRNFRVLPITIAALRYDPASGTLFWIRSVRVRVQFVRPADLQRQAAGAPYVEEEPRWESLYQQTILNYPRGRTYRRRPAEPGAIPAVPAWKDGAEQFRLEVDSTGVRRVRFEDLNAAGLEAEALTWEELKLVVRDYEDDASGDPHEEFAIAYRVAGDDGDGLFEPGEALLFYGQDAWEFFSLPPADRRYGRRNVYWLVHGDGPGVRMEQRATWFDWTGLSPTRLFQRTIRFEQNRHIGEVRQVQENGVNPEDGPLAVIGDHYNWTNPSAGDPKIKSVAFDMPAMLRPRQVCVRIQGEGLVDGNPNTDHQVRLWFSQGAAERDTTYALPGNPYIIDSRSSALACDDDPDVRSVRAGRNYLKIYLAWKDDGIDNVAGDRAGIDWFDVTFDGFLDIRDGRLQASLAGLTGQRQLQINQVPGSAADLVALDITDPHAPVELLVTPGQLNAGTLLLQVDGGDGSAPPELLLAAPAGIVPFPTGGLTRRAESAVESFSGEDYILVYPRSFANEVAPLVAHREGQGHRVLAASIESLYDTYTGGRPHPFAIKRLMRALWRQSTPLPDYLLLFGDASNDLGGYGLGLSRLQSDSVFVPTITSFGHGFQSYGTLLVSNELWFADNLAGNWNEPMNMFSDVHLGRVPCGSRSEAERFVSKVITYETTDLTAAWRNRLVMASDDEFSGTSDYRRRSGEYLFASITDSAIGRVFRDSVFEHMRVDSFYLSAYLDSVPELGRCQRDPDDPEECLRDTLGNIVLVPVNTYADLRTTREYTKQHVKPRMIEDLSRGALLWAYQGHSNSRELAHEELFVHYDQMTGLPHDIRLLGNLDKPFVFHGYGCHLAEFASAREGDANRGDAMAELLLFCCEDASRGAIGAIGSTDYESVGHDFQDIVFQTLFTDPPQDAQGRRRWRLGELVTHSKSKLSANKLERITYTLLGDPAVRHGINPPWIGLALNGELWDVSGAEYASARADDSLWVLVQVTDESYLEVPVVRDYFGEVPEDRLEVSGPDQLNRRVRINYRTQVQRRPYSLVVQATDYEGTERRVEVRIPFEVGLYEQVGDTLEPLAPEGIETTSRLAVTVRSGAHLDAADIRLLIDGMLQEPVQAALDQPGGEPMTWTLRYGDLPPSEEGSIEVTVEAVQHDGAALEVFSRQVDVGGIDLRIADAYWIPNPFAERSHLVYRLTDSASRARLRLYASSGRKVFEEEGLPSAKGTQHFLWDGRDGDGDAVGNGLYFYELTIWDDGGREVEPRILDKVVRVR